jgi:glycosyltransferase involved in cell wall biosynthesis
MSDKIVLGGSSVESELIEMGIPETKYCVINNCVPSGKPDVTESERKEILEHFELADTQFICTIGRFSKKKGMNVLAKAASEIEHDIDVVMVGDGPEMAKIQKIRRKIKTNNLKLPGIIWDDTKKRVLLEEAEAFIFPSYIEGFPLAPLEAMKYKCPVISSNIESVKDIMTCENTQFFEPGNHKDLAGKIDKIIQDDKRAEKLAQNAYEAVQDLSPETVCGRYEDLFCELKS